MTAKTSSFDKLVYQRVGYEFIAAELRKARLHLRIAVNPAAAAQTVQDMQAALRLYATQSAIARIRHDCHTDDAFYSDEQAYYDQTDARVALLVQSFYSTMLNSRHRAELENRYGRLIFRKAENLKETVNAAVVEDLAEESRLESTFDQLMSSATVHFDEAFMTLAELEPHLESADRLTRQRAHSAREDWYQQHGDSLDRLFDQMVAIRHRISQKLKLRSFTELGYKRMERFDYGREHIDALRQAVVRYIVPLTREIRRLQRRRLGVDELNHYDLPCLNPAGNPQVMPELAAIPQMTAQILGDITRQQPSFFQRLIDGGYLDLQPRVNKSPGGYCSDIINAGMPFILMNAGGTADDISTLLHEAGHAYATLRSMENMTLMEYIEPTMDVCEIHSTTMELFGYNHIKPFFGADAENYTLMHMTQALLFIPYGCLVDEFQHRIYDQPDMTAELRYRTWRELEKIYMPDVRYDEAPFLKKGGAWQMKAHIFVAPFYYIDYVLAQLVSLDLWRSSKTSPEKAWQCYDQLCGLGGRETFKNLLEMAGLASPFESGTIKRVAYAASSFLDL